MQDTVENLEWEIWKDIPGYEGRYMVSNIGRVKSLERYVKTKFSSYKTSTRILKWTWIEYKMVRLYNGQYKEAFLIHRLVAKAFIANTFNKKYINHIDGNKHNNHMTNLEWCTSSENLIHAYRLWLLWKQYHMRWRYGDMSNRYKLVAQFDINGSLIAKFNWTREASRKTWISDRNIATVCRGNRVTTWWYIWRYI